MAMQWRWSLGVLKDWEAEPLVFCPVLTNRTALSTLTGRNLHSYHWLCRFAWFFSNLKLFTCLFRRMKTPWYLNWKATKEKQNKLCSLKALLNPTNGCPAIFSLGFLFQWNTHPSLKEHQSMVFRQSLFHADCGISLKSRAIYIRVSLGPFWPWNM